MPPKPSLVLFVALLLFAAGGAQCRRSQFDNAAIAGPRVLTESPSLDDVIRVVNANSALVRSLYTTDATLTVPGAPSLRANIALERQRKLRLRAETALTGAELDMGSNDDLFWFWVRRNPPPTLYYCRHDKFAASAARQILPVDPEWLLDAVGLATFDPYHQHSPPQRNSNGNLEVYTKFSSPNGQMAKTTVVDAARGFVVEQRLYDERGTVLATALTSRHWRDPATGAIVPQQIEVNWPATQFTLKLDVKKWTVNNIPADPTQLFTMPNYPGWAVVDLADPNLRLPGVSAAPTAAGAPGSAANNSRTFVSPPAVAQPNLGVPPAAAQPAQSPRGDLIGFVPGPGNFAPGAVSRTPTPPTAAQSPFTIAPGMNRY